jgi:hypothetical protein
VSHALVHVCALVCPCVGPCARVAHSWPPPPPPLVAAQVAIHLGAEGTIAVSLLVSTLCPGFLAELGLMVRCRDPDPSDNLMALTEDDDLEVELEDGEDGSTPRSGSPSPFHRSGSSRPLA